MIPVMAITILLMVLPPLLQTFDTWDRKPEIPVAGHDTEATVVELSFECGLCLTVAWVSITVLSNLAVMLASVADALAPAASVVARALGTDYLLLLFSPPWRLVSLRI